MEGIAGVLGMLRVGLLNKPPGLRGTLELLLLLVPAAPADRAEKRCRSAAALAACRHNKKGGKG
jgi:hypothetical protein